MLQAMEELVLILVNPSMLLYMIMTVRIITLWKLTIIYFISDIIEFIPSEITVFEQSADKHICANITKPSVVDPQVTIQIQLLLMNFDECELYCNW